MSLLPSTNPLETPEILRRISRFVTTRDAAACARVCKAWFGHFASAIWHAIDFAVHKNLHQMDAKVLTKYGHHIRVAENVRSENHILVLIGSNARDLRELSITEWPPEFNAHISDLLRLVNVSIESLKISLSYSATTYFAVDSLLPTSRSSATLKLRSLEIHGLTMSRDAFSLLLRNCPSLTILDIKGSTLVSLPIRNKSYEDNYQLLGVTDLRAGFNQVFSADGSKGEPPLLVHFPNLRTWEMSGPTKPFQISIGNIRDKVTRHCPLLRELATWDSAPVASNMIAQAFEDLEVIGVENEHISAEIIMAILNHQETLKSVLTHYNENTLYAFGKAPRVPWNLLETGWIIQSIPRLCTRLERLELPLYEMNMDDIEVAKWGCKHLEVLYIRIKYLNTMEKIDRAIQLWKEGRSITVIGKMRSKKEETSASSSPQSIIAILPEDNSIEARVARHLLKFKNLQRVWLGWKIHEVHQE
ncbi:MAG: hypothetical protein J3Q66DRAFT_363166 [Benniella sp.]|nr:MAG: hypothetical protein J3Q66DRAFT_363166 [Benniella sp.]